MAEVTAFRNNATEFPIYGLPWVEDFPIFDNTGSHVPGAAGLDSEISKNGDTFVDCTNEATEIATSSGRYYLILTATEMQADRVSINVKTSTTDAKTTPISLLPRKLATVRSDTCAGGASGSVTLDAGASSIDGAYANCVIKVTIDGTVEVRKITAYNGSTKVATVHADWVTADPDNNDPFVIYQPEGVLVPSANVTHIAEGATAAQQLRRSAEGIYYGSVTGAADTTTLIDSGLTQSATDFWKGRIIIFLTGALAKQATDITAFDPATDKLTFTAVTSGPSGGDTYVIV